MHRFHDVPWIVFKRFLLEAPASGDLPATVVQEVDIQTGGHMEQGEGNISAGHKPEKTCTLRGLWPWWSSWRKLYCLDLILFSVMFVSFHHGIHDHLGTINSIFVTVSVHLVCKSKFGGKKCGRLSAKIWNWFGSLPGIRWWFTFERLSTGGKMTTIFLWSSSVDCSQYWLCFPPKKTGLNKLIWFWLWLCLILFLQLY